MKQALIFLCLIMILAACATLPGPKSQAEAGGTPTAENSAVQVTGTADYQGSKGADIPMIVLERSGGLAGITEKWSFYSDGRVVSDKRGEQKMDPAQIKVLVDELISQKFSSLPESSGPVNNCNDCYQYSITMNVNGTSKTITAVEGAPSTSADVMKVVDAINNLIPTNLK